MTTEFVAGSQPFTPIQARLGSDNVAVADLNGDGIPDLVVANGFSGTVSVLLGNGNGTFQTPQSVTASVVSEPELRG